MFNREFQFINNRFIEMLGYSEEELIGSSSRMIYPSDAEFEQVGKSNYEQIKEKGTVTVETVFKKKDGSLIDVLLSSTLLNLQNLSEGFTFTALDITDRKKSEQTRLELEAQLQQSLKMEAIGTMAGGMAHNFNNNLAIILGNLEMAQRKFSEPEKVKSYIGNAKTASLRSRDLIQKILIYSRKTKSGTKPVSLPQIIKETITLLHSTFPSTVNLQQTCRSDVTINADPSQLQEVLINLCNNAIHAMDEEGDLTVSLEVVDLKREDIPAQTPCAAGDYARISVQDTGSGITAETQKKIFDPFFTTKGVGKGTGMGLSTVQGIIDQHNGLIKVTSELGVGTTFDLYFPLTERMKEEHNLTVVSFPPGIEKILFVDDEEMLADIWSEMLREYGYQVTTITNSIKALKLFKESPEQFDLVISDQTMPGLSGKEFLKELLSIRPELPTIICSGYSSKINAGEARQLGASAFLMKPLELPVLLQTIRQVLDGEKE